MILHAEFRKKSPPLEGRVVVTWAAARSAEIFFLGLLLPPPGSAVLSHEEKYLLEKRTNTTKQTYWKAFWAKRKNTYWRNERLSKLVSLCSFVSLSTQDFPV